MGYTHELRYEKRIPGTNIWTETSYRTVASSVLRAVKRLRANPTVRNVVAVKL
jgi:hypothetical protein